MPSSLNLEDDRVHFDISGVDSSLVGYDTMSAGKWLLMFWIKSNPKCW